MIRALAGVSFGILITSAAAAFGQAPASFEAASVKPVPGWRPSGGGINERGAAGTGGGCPTSMRVDQGRVDFNCTTVAMLIGYAVRLSPDRVTGTDWMMALGSPRFNIVATLPQGASANQVPEIFQAPA
jgi:uncharacterized protein (TIGR03435 family)